MVRVAVVALFALGCVADPAVGDDLAVASDGATPLDAATTDLPAPPTSLAWERFQDGITGVWATSLVTDDSHFYVYGDYDGVYQLPAKGAPAAVRLFAGPVADYGVLHAITPDNQLLVTTASGTYQRAPAAAAWSTYNAFASVEAIVFGDRSYLLSNKTLYRSATLAPPGAFSAFTILPASAGDTVATSIGGAKWRVYFRVQEGLHYVEPATSATLVEQATAFSAVTALGGAARVLVGGTRTTDSVSGVSQLTATGALVDCGNPLPTMVRVVTLVATPSTNYAVTSDSHLYVNAGCSGAWTLAGSVPNAIADGVAAIPDGSNPDVLAFATPTSLFRSSNGGATWDDIAIRDSSVTILSLARDPSDPAHLFAGTAGRGAHLSEDGGAHWKPIAGLPSYDVEWTGTFASSDTLWLAAHCLASYCDAGGLYRGTRDLPGTYTFTRVGPFTSAFGVVSSPLVGTVACVFDPQPLRRLVGDTWEVITSPSDASCVGPMLSNDGATVFAGHLAGKFTVLADAAATPVASAAPVDAPVWSIVSIDGSADHLLVGTASGLFRVEPSLAGEVLFSGSSLGAIGALYDDAGRLWLAAKNERLLVSTDRGATWTRVNATTGTHPIIISLVRSNGDLLAGSVAGLWKATLF